MAGRDAPLSRTELARARAARSRRPRRLSRDAIVDVALRLVDAEGVDELSMRRVAAEFNTGPASLYAYFDNKEALLHAVLDRVIDEIRVPDIADWQQLLRDWAQHTRAVFLSHGDIARVSLAHIPTSSGMFDNAEVMVRRMVEGGVPPRVATWALDILALFVAADAYEGYLLARRFDDGSGRDAHDVGDEFVAGVSATIGQLDPRRYPYLMAHSADLMGGTDDERFAFGVDMLIAGFAAQATRRPRR